MEKQLCLFEVAPLGATTTKPEEPIKHESGVVEKAPLKICSGSHGVLRYPSQVQIPEGNPPPPYPYFSTGHTRVGGPCKSSRETYITHNSDASAHYPMPPWSTHVHNIRFPRSHTSEMSEFPQQRNPCLILTLPQKYTRPTMTTTVTSMHVS